MKKPATREEQLLATALFAVGDVVVTSGTVRVLDNTNSPSGGAPRWKWRVTAVAVVTTGNGLSLRYEVVADSAPLMYHGTLRAKQIARKVG